MSPWNSNRLANAVAAGAVFGYPTDTIWGFGCHPLIEESVSHILQIKSRPVDKGLILLTSRLAYCDDYIRINPEQLPTLETPAKRPTTWLVPASRDCPSWIKGRHTTVAVRVTNHPLLQALCDFLQSPIVSTSANRAGRPPARNQIQMWRQFGEELDCIVSGHSVGSGRASEIRYLDNHETVRASA